MAAAGNDSARPGLGMIMGEAPDDRIEALQAVPGVLDVEPASQASVPLPDSPLQ